MSASCSSCQKPKATISRSTIYSVSDYGDSDEKHSTRSHRSSRCDHSHDDETSYKSISECNYERRQFYKPRAIRNWVLAVFLLGIILAIVLLELAVAAHPSSSQVHGVRKRDGQFGQHHVLQVRQESGSITSDTATPTTPGTSQTTTVSPSQPPSSEQLTITTTITSQQNQVTESQQQATSEPSQTAAPAPSTEAPPPTSETAAESSQATETPVSSEIPSDSADASSEIEATDSFETVSTTIESSTITDANGQATTVPVYVGTVVPKGSTGTSSVPSTRSSSSNNAKATGVTSSDQQNDDDDDDDSGSTNYRTFTRFDYFLAKYLPVLLGVVMQSAWLIVYSTFKLMEPFYQLARPGGAPAGMSLTSAHLSYGLSLSFVSVALDGQWVLFLAGQVQFGLSVIVTLVSECMDVEATAFCRTEIAENQPCEPVWVVNIGIVRAVEVFLIICFVMVLGIGILNRSRVSGVFSDPSRIATIADLLVHRPLIRQLRDLPLEATKTQVEEELSNSRYMLGTFESNGCPQYGIIRLDTPSKSGPPSFVMPTMYKQSYDALQTMSRRIAGVVGHVVETMPILPDLCSLALSISLFSLILAYYCVHTGPFNDWMNSRFGPTLLLTVMAILVSYLVKSKEQLLRLSEPYMLMAKDPSKPAAQTITAGTKGSQFESLYKSIKNRDISLAFMSTAAILSDLLLILIPGVPFSYAQTAEVYHVSTWFCIVILVLIFIAQVRITYKDWKRSSRAHETRPETMASGLMTLCASRFVEDKNSRHDDQTDRDVGVRTTTGSSVQDEQNQRLRYEGVMGERRYVFGLMEGVDGQRRYMVDEDVMPQL
ncbi:hypothetical protein B0A52_10310 [Exophiala mesophila]|uniref:Uncharacterized protein n=1 Tax=Exophiala mesophila TaxID=212818 RepID=A0A438MQ86_EXOME|nr:hypothetical protein B0A52_10310 [Exophiala mesophila]